MSDYLNARAGRNERAVTVAFTTQLVGVIFLLPLVLLGNSQPTLHDLTLGLLAGLAGTAGLVTFIRGASTHQMGIVVPLSAVSGAVLPVAVGLLAGDSYGLTGWLGLCAALV